MMQVYQRLHPRSCVPLLWYVFREIKEAMDFQKERLKKTRDTEVVNETMKEYL